MDIRQYKRGDATVVAPTGRIDSTTSDALEKALARLVDAGERKLVVDFSGVDYISSAGLRVFLVVAKRQKDLRGTLELTAMADAVRQVFDLAGLLPLFVSAGVVISAEAPAEASATVFGRPPAGAAPAAAPDKEGASDGPALRLRIEAPGGHVTERSFDAPSIVFGRSERADVPISDQSVSRQHARFVRLAGGWAVEDLGSRNGTLFNEKPASGQIAVKPGDVIRIGDTRLTVRPAAGEEAPLSPTAWGVSAAADDSMVSVLRPAAELMHASGSEASSRLRLLNEVHRALAAPISRTALLELILDRTFDALKPEDAAIFLRNDEGQLYRAAERRSSAAAGPLLVSRRLADEVAGKGAAALVLDAAADERFSGSESIVASGVRSIVAAPLLDGEGCLGMIALYSRLQVRRFSEDDLELLVSLAAAAALRVRNLALAEDAAMRQVQDREMALAHDIQMGMLARRVPDIAEADVAARLRPARTVGGDLYDVVRTGDTLWFIAGDVSGKGFAAALVMAIAQTLFRALTPLGLSLPELVARMNRELCRENDRAMFVTACAGRLDLRTGRLEMVNAGHNLPYWLKRDGAVQTAPLGGSLALGVLDSTVFELTESLLGPGDGLMIYTDGASDALDPQGASFGTPRIEAYLTAHSKDPAAEIVRGLFELVDAFAGSVPQEDDITLLVLRYRGPQA
jgi:anti-anti-sigma factor